MQDSLTKILKDIYALDPALEEKDTEVKAMIAAFLADKPKVSIDNNFARNLRASLVTARVSEKKTITKPLPWWVMYLAPLGAAAVLILMLIPDYNTKPTSRPTTFTAPATEIEDSVSDESSFNTFEMSAPADIDNKRSAVPEEGDVAETSLMQVMGDLPPAESLLVSTQEPGNKVLVDYVSLLVPGYVVIKTDKAGDFGEIIGVSPVLPDGLSEKVEIMLSTMMENDQNFYAVLYFDNGDGVFDGNLDLPIFDATGTLPFYQMFSTTPLQL